MLELRKFTKVNAHEEYPMTMEITWVHHAKEIFLVGGFNEGDCLDNFADYCNENGFMGAFLTADEVLELEDEVIYAGNYCHPMDLNMFAINFRGEL
jgi:hypothetical protein